MNGEGWPDEGEFLVCTVKRVKENGAYLSLDGYDEREGFVFIGEIASGWVRNIRAHIREGQRVVAKAMRVRRDRLSVELSIKAVNEERRRDTLQRWKNEQRATQLLKIVGERAKWEEGEAGKKGIELTEAFGTLYGAFEEAAINPASLGELEFEGEWTKILIELADENIIPPFVIFRGNFEIEVWGLEGVDAIREALLEAETHTDEEAEVFVSCHYDGAPRYRVEIKAPDFKMGLAAWNQAVASAETSLEGIECSFDPTHE